MCSYNCRLRDSYFLYAVALALFFAGTPSNMHCSFQDSQKIIYFMQLQFWRFSELILHNFLGEG